MFMLLGEETLYLGKIRVFFTNSGTHSGQCMDFSHLWQWFCLLAPGEVCRTRLWSHCRGHFQALLIYIHIMHGLLYQEMGKDIHVTIQPLRIIVYFLMKFKLGQPGKPQLHSFQVNKGIIVSINFNFAPGILCKLFGDGPHQDLQFQFKWAVIVRVSFKVPQAADCISNYPLVPILRLPRPLQTAIGVDSEGLRVVSVIQERCSHEMLFRASSACCWGSHN